VRSNFGSYELPFKSRRKIMGRALILWLLGVPVGVIVLIALFTNFI
jgi:hypothetical protein